MIYNMKEKSEKMLVASYIVFMMNPLISSVFIVMGFVKDRKNSTHYSFLFAGVLASLAYWVIPKGAMDLTRYFDIVLSYETMSFDFFYSDVLFGDLMFIQNILFYSVGRTGNIHLLPSIVIFISYFIMLYMITDYANRMKATTFELLLAIIFLLCVMPFISLVSNVRNILAFSLITYGIYREFIQDKKGVLTFILYAVPCFIHISSLSIILLRLIAGNSSNKKMINWMILTLGVFITIFIFYNASMFSALPLVGEYLGALISKTNIYLFDSSSYYAQILQNDTFSKMQKLYFTLSTLYLLILLICISSDSKNLKIESYFKYVAIMVVISYPIILTVYFRYTMGVLMLAFLVIYRIKFIKHKDWRLLIYIGLLFIMVGGLTQQILFFNSLAYLNQMIVNMGTRSIFNMFFQ